MKRQKAINISLSVAITIAFILFGVFVFKISYIRTFEALTALWSSIKYYFGVLFNLDIDGIPSIVNKSEVLNGTIFLPSDFGEFKDNSVTFWELFFSKGNFLNWLDNTAQNLDSFARISILLLPCVIALIVIIKTIYERPNNKHNKDSFPLRAYRKIYSKTILPTKNFLAQYYEFIMEKKWLRIIWIIMWVFNLNFASIIISFLAYYFYFAVSFDLSSLYIQFVNLFTDFTVLTDHVPIWVLIPVALLIFGYWRKQIALNTLRHKESQNCGFINSLPIVSMTCGSMGKKKTTIITDMALSQDVMFREKAFELLQKNDMRFPHFPWIAFEMEIRKCMEHHIIYNLASISEWVKLKEKRYNKHLNANCQLYGYDINLYGRTYCDELKTYDLFEVLEAYAKLYFIYVIQSSLLVSNYSIREDSVLSDEGNFPLWSTDFFVKRGANASHTAHILDFDVLRLGKKVLADNINTGSFEFGVVCITEVGKERGNNLELKEVKKGTNETNQKNDLFNNWLKMCRHSATVDNFPFIKVFTDEQRPESWGADARDLADIVTIITTGETKLALPFYVLEDMLAEKVFNRFTKMYYDFRFRRGDNTLFMHIMKSLANMIYQHNLKVYNRFGYSTVYVQKEQGTMDGKKRRERYHLMNYKIYKTRFSTDCFSDYFKDLASNAKVGLDDYITYATEKASVDELKQQNSYFINALYNDRG